MDQNSELTASEAEQILNGLCIPPCPEMLTKLLQELRGDDPDFNKINQLITNDASIAAAMMKTVNSAYYGLCSKATSVRQAINLLGLRRIGQLVAGVLLRDAFVSSGNARLNEYWNFSSRISQLSAYLAGHFDGIDRDDMHTFALFRDCGVLAMMNSFKDYKLVLPKEALEYGTNLIAHEDRLHKINHARVGARLARIWSFPEEIYQPILWHHEYATLLEGREIIAPVHARKIALSLVAEWILADQSASFECDDWRNGRIYVLADLAITTDDLKALKEQTVRESGMF